MNYYLIDYENVKDLTGIENLTQNDKVIIFYSNNAANLSMKTFKKIQDSKAKVVCKEVTVAGKNALDFQLSTYLGYLIKENENNKSTFYIMSKDKGFNNVDDFWNKEKNIDIKIIVNFTGLTQKSVIKNNTDNINNLLKNSDLNLTKEEIQGIIEIVKKFSTKTAINNNMCKLLKDNVKVGKILKVIKDCIKDKK